MSLMKHTTKAGVEVKSEELNYFGNVKLIKTLKPVILGIFSNPSA